ncbi:MAG: hypothetical protein QOH31_6054 [Verrucomicrobiota bacterium]
MGSGSKCSKPGTGTNSTFCADLILSRVNCGVAGAQHPHRVQLDNPGKRKPEGHDSGPFANYPARSMPPRSAPSPSPVTADFVRSAEPFNRISLLVAEIIDAHERYAFRGEKLHKSDSHPFGGSQYRVLPNFKRNLSLFLAPRHFNRKV